jgi:putative hydrolase of the HAD superfamily
MIEAVLFDYGMVLSGPADPAAWQRMLDITGLAQEQFQQGYWAPRHAYDRGTHSGAEYWQIAGRHAGVELTPAQIAALIEADTDLWTQLNPPMIEWAARLQAAGTRTGILSNLGDAMTAGVEARMLWLKGFDTVIFSHRLKLAKPEREIYQKAAEGLQTQAANILFVDDRADNCAGARAAGMQVIQYLEHAAFVAEMESRGLGELWLTGTTSKGPLL